MNNVWTEYNCKCGYGDPHVGYLRSDYAAVTIDHSENGKTLKKRLFCANGHGEILKGRFTDFQKAMIAMDEQFPIEDKRRKNDC